MNWLCLSDTDLNLIVTALKNIAAPDKNNLIGKYAAAKVFDIVNKQKEENKKQIIISEKTARSAENALEIVISESIDFGRMGFDEALKEIRKQLNKD